MIEKPYSEACEQNAAPILDILTCCFKAAGIVLEIGSGTGQHSVSLPVGLPHLQWLPSDVQGNLPGIRTWLAEADLENVAPPVALDVNDELWPVLEADYVFSANTSHIMSWPSVEAMFAGVGKLLVVGGQFCLYGPFNEGGRYSSIGNLRFDQWLRQRDPDSGLRDIEKLEELGLKSGLLLTDRFSMPVNNRILRWTKIA